MTVIFVLYVWMGGVGQPADVFTDHDECWEEAKRISGVVEAADCRQFTSPSPVGPAMTYAPLTSPRPKPRPDNLVR